MDDLVKRADEALKDVTPGPWEAVFDRQTWGWLEVDGPSFNVSAPTRATDLSLADAVQRKKDARFIAAARELVPLMRDRIEADAKRIAELVADFNRQVERTDEQRAAYEARIAELEAALRPFVEIAKDRVADAPEWQDSDSVAVILEIGDLRAALEGEK